MIQYTIINILQHPNNLIASQPSFLEVLDNEFDVISIHEDWLNFWNLIWIDDHEKEIIYSRIYNNVTNNNRVGIGESIEMLNGLHLYCEIIILIINR